MTIFCLIFWKKPKHPPFPLSFIFFFRPPLHSSLPPPTAPRRRRKSFPAALPSPPTARCLKTLRCLLAFLTSLPLLFFYFTLVSFLLFLSLLKTAYASLVFCHYNQVYNIKEHKCVIVFIFILKFSHTKDLENLFHIGKDVFPKI